jgi:hypothetical protein
MGLDHLVNQFLGVLSMTVLVVEFLKSKVKWFNGKEAWMAVVLPLLLSISAKFGGCTSEFAQLPWGKLVLNALLVGVFAQVAHDKLYNPFVKPSIKRAKTLLSGLLK